MYTSPDDELHINPTKSSRIPHSNSFTSGSIGTPPCPQRFYLEHQQAVVCAHRRAVGDLASCIVTIYLSLQAVSGRCEAPCRAVILLQLNIFYVCKISTNTFLSSNSMASGMEVVQSELKIKKKMTGCCWCVSLPHSSLPFILASQLGFCCAPF
jgi:hypothetical protein